LREKKHHRNTRQRVRQPALSRLKKVTTRAISGTVGAFAPKTGYNTRQEEAYLALSRLKFHTTRANRRRGYIIAAYCVYNML